MDLEVFFESISYICMKVLPLLGVVLLIYLILMVRNIIAALKSATKTLDEANLQLRKLDIPLNTVCEISKSIDYVHESAKESLKSISLSLYESITALKEWIVNTLHKKDTEETVTEPVDLNEDVPTSEMIASEDAQ